MIFFSCKACKIVPFHANFSEINIYYPHNLFQTVNVVSSYEWSICYTIILWLFTLSTCPQIMRTYTQFRCSFYYCYTGYHFVSCSGNKSSYKDIKSYTFRIRSGMCKRSKISYNGRVWKTARKGPHTAVSNMVYIIVSENIY